MRGSRLLNLIPKFPKLPEQASAVTHIEMYGSTYVLDRYHEFMVEIEMFFTSSGDASARATSGLFGLVTSRLLQALPRRRAAALATERNFFIGLIELLVPCQGRDQKLIST